MPSPRKRAVYDPDYVGRSRRRVPDQDILRMRQTILALERRGVTRADIARAADVHKVLISRLFHPQRSNTGTSKAYAHKICRGLIPICRRHHVDPSPIEEML